MRGKTQTLVLLIIAAILMASCDPKQTGETKAEPTPTTMDSVKLDSSFDLKDPDFYDKFIKYFVMDKPSLVETLQQDYMETPIEGRDQNTDTPWIKLSKSGLLFHLTEEKEVPVSHVDIAEVSPIHLGGAKANMKFANIMKLAGNAMIFAESSPDGDGKVYSIIYPMEEASVIFTADNVFENTATMMISSWGYYDNPPTLYRAKEINTNYGSLSLPDDWVGRFSLEDTVGRQEISYLGHNDNFPLFELISMNKGEWDTMSKNEQDTVVVLDRSEERIIAAKKLEFEPRDMQESQEYREMESQVEKIFQSYKSKSNTQSATSSESDPESPLCTDSVTQLMDVDQVVKAYEEYHDEHSTDYSERAIDEYYIEMGQCFSDKIRDLMKVDSSMEDTINNLRPMISQLTSTWSEIQYFADGGGSMWVHMSTRQLGMNEVAVFIYLKQLETEKGQEMNEAEFEQLIDQLSEYKLFYKERSIIAMNEEDAGRLELSLQQIEKTYDELINSMEQFDHNGAAVHLLQYLVRYNNGNF